MAYVQLAFCYMNQNQSQQAMESMKRAVACGKNRAQVFNHFGELCMAMGLFSDADMNFKKAEEADKDWAYSYVNEATYYLQTTQDYLKASDPAQEGDQDRPPAASTPTCSSRSFTCCCRSGTTPTPSWTRR